MTAVEWVELGRLGAPYGIKGWLHVESYTEPPEKLLDYPVWTLRLASGERVERQLLEGRQIEFQLLLGAAGDRIEEPDVLEARAALALAAVGYYHVVEGLVARPAPRQANSYHDRIALVQ